jgi:hypothetical protein
MSTNIRIQSSNEADKAVRDFAASKAAAAYWLSYRETTILDREYVVPGLDRLLKYKKTLKKLWQETMD